MKLCPVLDLHAEVPALAQVHFRIVRVMLDEVLLHRRALFPEVN